ncbi:MAG TPA: hypothetical protein VHM91_13000 [Verrucomicrobiales bacterium]|jgi:hypothetical protein|nr:hypothetical protein [Verrucomicrobiales bacterium]
MKRRLWKLLLLFTGILVLALTGLQFWVSSRFSVEGILKHLTESYNCRASAGSASVKLYSFPARSELRDLKITPFDETESPATPGETFLKVDQASLEVNLWSLLTGEADVKKAVIDGVSMQTVKWAEGGNSLRLLLSKPGTGTHPPAPPATLEDTDEIPGSDTDASGVAVKPFHISELPVTSTLREARIRNASWTIVNQRKKTIQQFKDCNFVLTGMTIDPSNPSAGGTAHVSAGTRLIIDSQARNLRTVDFILSLEGSYQIVDPVTGNLNNDLEFTVTVKKGSLINRIPTLVKINESLDNLKSTIGLDLNVPPEATLTEDTVLHGRLKDGVIRLEDPVFFPFDTYQLALDKGSWLSLRDDQHQFNGKLLASGPISTKAVSSIRAFLDKRSSSLSALVSKTVLNTVVNKDGHIELPFQSKADIGRPDVNLSEKFMDILKRAGAEAGKDLLKDAIDGGDDIKNIIDAVKDLRKKNKEKDAEGNDGK